MLNGEIRINRRMNNEFKQDYDKIRDGGSGLYGQPRGLIAVWGKESVQFLDGLITNDMKTLADGEQILAAFPSAQGRLVAIVRVLRQGDRFLLDTEEATREKLFQNLFRFTFAGDFFVEDLSDNFKYFEIFGAERANSAFVSFSEIVFGGNQTTCYFVPVGAETGFRAELTKSDLLGISDELYELLRIENGVPKYGIDMDDTTIVPELGLDDMISYKKGCYIGQEIIARIYFRGHVAKRLTGIVSEPGAISTGLTSGTELTASDGKNAGRITSIAYSPSLDRDIALAYVRYDHLASGTELLAGDISVTVTDLPFVG